MMKALWGMDGVVVGDLLETDSNRRPISFTRSVFECRCFICGDVYLMSVVSRGTQLALGKKLRLHQVLRQLFTKSSIVITAC